MANNGNSHASSQTPSPPASPPPRPPLHLSIRSAQEASTAPQAPHSPVVPSPTQQGTDQDARARIPVLVDLIPFENGQGFFVSPPYTYVPLPFLSPPAQSSQQAPPTPPPSRPTSPAPLSPPPPTAPQRTLMGVTFVPVFFGPPSTGHAAHANVGGRDEGQGTQAGSGREHREDVQIDATPDGRNVSVPAEQTPSTTSPPPPAEPRPFVGFVPPTPPSSDATTTSISTPAPTGTPGPLPPSAFTFPYIPLSPTSGFVFDPRTGTLYHVSFGSTPSGTGDAPVSQPTPRASPRVISRLPVIPHISPAFLSHFPHCPICLSAFPHGDLPHTGAKSVVAMECKHVFHRGCLEEWLGRSNMCPVCRWEVETGNGEFDRGVGERNKTRVEGWKKSERAVGKEGEEGGDGTGTSVKEIGWAEMDLETLGAPSKGPLEYLAPPPAREAEMDMDTEPASATNGMEHTAEGASTSPATSSPLHSLSRTPSIRVTPTATCALDPFVGCLLVPPDTAASETMGQDGMDMNVVPAPKPSLRLSTCAHAFHTPCLAAALRVRRYDEEAGRIETMEGGEMGEEGKNMESGEVGGEGKPKGVQVEVRCPVCRKVGAVERCHGQRGKAMESVGVGVHATDGRNGREE